VSIPGDLLRSTPGETSVMDGLREVTRGVPLIKLEIV